MALREHLFILRMGVSAWNQWRREHVPVVPDLRAADLRERDLNNAQLTSADLRRANLTLAQLVRANLIQATLEEANLTWTNLHQANLTQANLRSAMLFKSNLCNAILRNANLSGASLIMADLERADLKGANFHDAYLVEAGLQEVSAKEVVFRHAHLIGAYLAGADLTEADFTHADLTFADLTAADLSHARLSDAILTGAILNRARIVGVLGWDADLHATQQRDLVVTPEGRLRVTVDGLDAAQYLLLLFQHPALRELAHPLHSTAALILGEFRGNRTEIRDILADALREEGYTPITFYVEKETSRDLEGTIRRVIPLLRVAYVDLTGEPSIRSLLEELSWGGVPVQPLVHGLSENLRLVPFSSSRRILPLCSYEDASSLKEKVSTELIPRLKAKNVLPRSSS